MLFLVYDLKQRSGWLLNLTVSGRLRAPKYKKQQASANIDLQEVVKTHDKPSFRLFF